jgi:hypothetical protein
MYAVWRLSRFAVAMSVAALMATLLLGVEAATWAAAYRLLGALPDNKLAMLYSLRRCSSMRRFGGRASASLGNDVRVVIRLATGLSKIDDIVPAYVFLGSDEARYFVGQCLSPNGGDVMPRRLVRSVARPQSGPSRG